MNKENESGLSVIFFDVRVRMDSMSVVCSEPRRSSTMTAPPATQKTITVLRTTEHSLGLSPTTRQPAVYRSELSYLVTWCEGSTLVLNFKKTSVNFQSGFPQAMKCREKVRTVRRCLVSPYPTATPETWTKNRANRDRGSWRGTQLLQKLLPPITELCCLHISECSQTLLFIFSVLTSALMLFLHFCKDKNYVDTTWINARTCFSLLAV